MVPTLAAGYESDRGGGVVLFDVARCARLVDQPLPVAEGKVSSVAFSPDGATLAAGYRGREIDVVVLLGYAGREVGGGVVLFDVVRRPG